MGNGHTRTGRTRDTYDLLLFALLGPRGLVPLGGDVGINPGLADDPGGGGVRELEAELSQVQVVHPVFLTGDSCAGSIDEDAVLVDHVNDDDQLTLQGSNRGLGHAASFHKSLERLQGERRSV